MCSTRNRYRSDFSLMFLNRGFEMSSRAWSHSTFSSGLWSTTTVRSGHPNVKCCVLLRASATASDLPSIGAYHDSAPCVKRLPISTTFQPDMQQNGRTSAHLASGVRGTATCGLPRRRHKLEPASDICDIPWCWEVLYRL